MFCFFHNCMWQSKFSEINVYFLHLGGRTVVHPRVSPFLIIGFWVDSLGVLAASNYFWIQFCHPIIFKTNLWKKSSWHIHFLVFDLSRFHHKKGWLRSILFDRTSILFIEQAVYRPNSQCSGVFSTSVCTMQDVVWSFQALADLCDSYAWDSRL